MSSISEIGLIAAFATGYMSVFSYWMLENFPILATIG